MSSSGLLATSPVDWSHPLNRGRLNLWLATPNPGWRGGRLFDLVGLSGRQGAPATRVGASWSAARPGGWGSLDFDGVDDYATAPAYDAPYLGPLTMSCWALVRTGNAYRYFFGKHTSNGIADNPFNLGTGNEATPTLGVVRAAAGAFTVYGGPAVVLGSWTHYAAVCYTNSSDGPVDFYVNGVLTTGTLSFTTGSGAPTGNGAPIRFGARDDNVALMDGLMDAVSIWGRALSADAVRQEMRVSRRGYPGVLRRPPRPRAPGTAGGGAAVSPAAYWYYYAGGVPAPG